MNSMCLITLRSTFGVPLQRVFKFQGVDQDDQRHDEYQLNSVNVLQKLLQRIHHNNNRERTGT